ncbi:hypothetical protein ACFPH8_10575 [Bizionia hallyeonensis]|uniref:Uncharacterized protein n=1 Tax=Bizionia hallyeonensis TaxID=1123757 RepID=A0ABW0C933_9FLAO
MSKLALIDYVLNPAFKVNDNLLEEPQASMKVALIQDRCKSIVFEFDKKLGKEYKGGIFPFFNNQNSKVCKVCDYIIFSEFEGSLYALVIELKTSAQSTLPQIKAGECFVDYIISTVNRINNTNHTIQKRRVSIREFQRKKKTKLKEIEYDENNHHFFDQNRMRIVSFLK